MDLSKFVSLLQKRALIFPRSDCLGDPFEGSYPVANAWSVTNFMHEIALQAEGGNLDKIGQSDLESISQTMVNFRKNVLRAAFVSCWHMNEAESAAMWRLYSSSNDAVCIRTDYQTLASLLPDDIILGTVRYMDYKVDRIESGNFYAPLMIKRRSFDHEREARAIIFDSQVFQGEIPPTLKEVAVDIHRLIKQVYVSPNAPDWFHEVVLGLSVKYQLSVPVGHSEMTGDPLY